MITARFYRRRFLKRGDVILWERAFRWGLKQERKQLLKIKELADKIIDYHQSHACRNSSSAFWSFMVNATQRVP